MLYLDAKPISATELAKKYEISIPTKTVVFEMLPKLVSVDTLNNTPKFSKTGIPKDFIGTDKQGESVRITFSERPLARNEKTHNMDLKDPKRYIEFFSVKRSVNPVTDKEEFVFLSLYSRNVESPFYNGKKGLYRKQDLHGNAKETMKKKEFVMGLQNSVNGFDGTLEQLRVRASGMGIHHSNDMTEEEIKVALFGLIDINAEKFHQGWTTQDTGFKGVLNLARERGILTTDVIHGLERVYVKGAEGPKEVGVVPKDHPGGTNQYIYDLFANSFEGLYLPLKDQVEGKQVMDLGKKLEASQNNTKDKVEKLWLKRMLVIKEDGGAEWAYQKLKGKEDKALFRIENADNYIDETVAFFEIPANGALFGSMWATANRK